MKKEGDYKFYQEAGIIYSFDPLAKENGFYGYEYSWKYFDEDEKYGGEKIVYIKGLAFDLLKLINHWNRNSEGYIYWTEEI